MIPERREEFGGCITLLHYPVMVVSRSEKDWSALSEGVDLTFLAQAM